MARHIYQKYAVDGNGNIVTDATVSVYDDAAATMPSSLYTTSSGGPAISSVTSDSVTGLITFYVDEADYAFSDTFYIQITKTNYSFDLIGPVSIFDTSTSYLTGHNEDGTHKTFNDIIAKGPVVDVRAFLPAGFVTDGSVDYSTEIQNALDYGQKIVDGANLTYKINSTVTVPANTELRNFIFKIGTAGINAILVNNGSKIKGTIIGTGTTNIIERGIYPAVDGVSDVKIDVDVSNITFGVHLEPLSTLFPERCKIKVYAHDIVGATGASEGYGVLLSGANSNYGTIIAKNIKRHALYLSNGASYNDFFVDVNVCGNYAIQLFGTSAQTAVAYNKIRGTVRGLYQTTAGEAIGVGLIQKTNYNDIQVNVVGNSATDMAVKVQGVGIAGGPNPKGNAIHDCKITGQFIASDVIRDENGDGTEIKNNTIDAYSTFDVIGVRTAGTPDVPSKSAFVEHNKINAQSQNIIGIYDEVTTAVSYIGINDIRGNGTGLRVNSSAAGNKRHGHSRQFSGEITFTSVPAGGSANSVVTYPEPVATPFITASIVSQSLNNSDNTCHIDASSSTSMTVYCFNKHTSNQDIKVHWKIFGD